VRSERSVPSRAITIAGGTIAVAGIAVALTLYGSLFTQMDWVFTAFGVAAMYFVASNALPVRGLRLRRSGLAAEAIFHDLPIAAMFVSMGPKIGPTAGALVYAAGFLLAVLTSRREDVADIPRHGILRVLVCLAILAFGGSSLDTINALPQEQQMPVAALAAFALVVVYNFVISAPISATTFHIPLLRVWERIARDPRWWAASGLSIFWVVVGRSEVILGHYGTAIALWVPVIIIAILLRTIDNQSAELHRLRLVRDAVQAMLGDRDPLPQINAILASLRVQAFDETVSVLAATNARTDAWRVVTTLGPTVGTSGDELGRRILARLKFSGSAYTSLADDYNVAYAFAARLTDGEIHGALTVHRRKDRPLGNEHIAQFTNSAAELAPLLRDMRRIAATQSAATIDALTGLANRANVMERLQVMLSTSSAESGGVLLLDIDHFKTINDQLGHAAGDECLRKIGEIIRATVRAGDTAGRIGGEEFLIVMPGASRDVALSVGDRLRLAISLGGMRYANGDPVTTSIGAAAVKSGDTIETILARADRGLYEAKRLGRNRIVDDLESA
jgi:diguanylate cyclase (GGDEF)-like protein